MQAPGTLVWAKVRGYPWWPGKIKSISDVPKELASYAARNYRKETVFAVFFFGSHDYALITPDQVKPLDQDWEELSAKGTGPKFRTALIEARLSMGHGADASLMDFLSDVVKEDGEEEEVKKEKKKKKIKKKEKLKGEKRKRAASIDIINEEDLPTNAFIEIDPETGEQTIKKRRGRPPKVRPDDCPAVQYKASSKKKNKKPSVYPLIRIKRYKQRLQRILLRPELDSSELPRAQELILRLFQGRRCSRKDLETSGLGTVLARAMKRGLEWAEFPEMMPSFRLILKAWKTLPSVS